MHSGDHITYDLRSVDPSDRRHGYVINIPWSVHMVSRQFKPSLLKHYWELRVRKDKHGGGRAPVHYLRLRRDSHASACRPWHLRVKLLLKGRLIEILQAKSSHLKHCTLKDCFPVSENISESHYNLTYVTSKHNVCIVKLVKHSRSNMNFRSWRTIAADSCTSCVNST